MIADPSALPFEIPARDALGREHVEGQLVAAEEALQFFWRFRQRTFKASGQEMQMVSIEYGNVENLELRTTLFRFNPRLLLELTDPRPLAAVPGIQVGAAALKLTGRKAAEEARRFIKLVEFRKSEAAVKASIGRMSSLGRKGESLTD